MKIINLFIKTALIFFVLINSLIAEIEFESDKIDIKDNGNIILSYGTNLIIPSKKLEISSDKAKYIKNEKIVTFTGNVKIKDKKNNLNIDSDQVIYNESEDLIFSQGDTRFNFENNYLGETKNIFLDRNNGKLYGSEKTKITDSENNIIELNKEFEFSYKDEIIKSKQSTVTDNNKNKYFFEDLIIDLKNNNIAGKELKIEFEKSYFGNEKNNPLLKGRSSYSNDQQLKVYKAVFSTCNIENKKCRGWELNTDEFTHDKTKNIFEYKNTWLKIFDKKFFYLPYFNHPDPTIERKSGFLTPSYSSSESLGTSINFPYFKILDVDKDITFNPRYYADKSFLLQNEYRQALENSNVISDFSFLVGDAGTKGHFFYNQIGSTKIINNYELNLQDVKGDNYLKNHNLAKTSNLIKDDNILLSNLDLDFNFEESSLSTSFKIYEDLSRNYHDRYQYIFPDFNFKRNIDISKGYNGRFNFNSYGYNKYYDTNIIETVITNDFLFKSNEYINNAGIVTNYDFLVKNSNNYSKNSLNFEEDAEYDLFGTLKLDTSYPLRKKMKNSTNYFKPIASLRYSPNGNTDLSLKDILLNYNTVFNLNRIGSTYEVEGGESLSLGFEFKKEYIETNKFVEFKIANVLKNKENIKLPKKSKLNKTRSDIFGEINYKYSENFNFGYLFSYDRDLKYSNLEEFKSEFSVNNFITEFSYYVEDNDIGNKESATILSKYNIDDENSVSFELKKNLKEDFTQFYDLIYTYETDCISIDLNFNKSFYNDGNLEPSKSISFLVRILPFTELGVSSLGTLGN